MSKQTKDKEGTKTSGEENSIIRHRNDASGPKGQSYQLDHSDTIGFRYLLQAKLWFRIPLYFSIRASLAAVDYFSIGYVGHSWCHCPCSSILQCWYTKNTERGFLTTQQYVPQGMAPISYSLLMKLFIHFQYNFVDFTTPHKYKSI